MGRCRRIDSHLIEAVKSSSQPWHCAVGKIDDRTRAELNITARARLQTLRENYPRIGEYALTCTSATFW